VVVEMARMPQTVPSSGAAIVSGSRSGRSMKWMRPTGWPATTWLPTGASASKRPDSGAKR
jgi:hypothetical protein